MVISPDFRVELRRDKKIICLFSIYSVLDKLPLRENQKVFIQQTTYTQGTVFTHTIELNEYILSYDTTRNHYTNTT